MWFLSGRFYGLFSVAFMAGQDEPNFFPFWSALGGARIGFGGEARIRIRIRILGGFLHQEMWACLPNEVLLIGILC